MRKIRIILAAFILASATAITGAALSAAFAHPAGEGWTGTTAAAQSSPAQSGPDMYHD